MNDLGDWLYVIILIIAGISSMISSARKKAKQKAEESLPREIFTGDVFEDEYWGPEATNSQQNKRASFDPPKTKTKQKRRFETKPYFTGQEEGASAFEHQNTEEEMQTEIEYASITIEDLPRETNEWRKAFIYNEVFNRKY